MGFRELTVTDVREVLRRWQAGHSARQVARDGVMSRRTAMRYIEAAKKLGFSLEAELSVDIVRAVADSVQRRAAPAPSPIRQVLEQHRPRIAQLLGELPPLPLVRIQALLEREGVIVPYTTLRRYVRSELGWRENAPQPLVTPRSEEREA